MSDDDRAPALKHFIAELNGIWRAAGPPSYAEFEAISRKFTQPVQPSGLRVMTLPHATTQGILTGQRRTLPKWPWVASFVTVLRAVAARNGINPESLGTLADWKAKHMAADESLRRVKSADHEPDESDDPLVTDMCTVPMAINRRRHRRNTLVPTADGQVLTYAEREPAGRANLLALAKRFSTSGWWHDYRDVIPEWCETYLSLEPAATLIRSYETELIPDLLQVEAYAATAIRCEHAAASAAEVRRRVELRMLRQQILYRTEPVKLWVTLDEGVLRRRLGVGEVMRAQLDHLIDISQRTNVTVQVIRTKDGHSVVGGSITVLRFADQELPDVTFIEQPPDALYPSRPGDNVRFGQLLDRVGIEAESPAATTELLRLIRIGI